MEVKKQLDALWEAFWEQQPHMVQHSAYDVARAFGEFVFRDITRFQARERNHSTRPLSQESRQP